MKKLVSLLLAITMIATMIPVLALGATAQDAEIPANAVKIGDKAEFLAYFTGSSKTVTDYVVITENIDLYDYDNNTPYNISTQIATLGNGAVIDGGGHKITGFTMKSAVNHFSMFNFAQNTTVTIKNIVFGGAGEEMIKFSHETTSDHQRAGFLFHGANGSLNLTMTNVAIYAEMINANQKLTHMGMIVAYFEPSTHNIQLTNVNLHGSISTNGKPAGAFFGTFTPTATGSLKMTNCANNADVSLSGSDSVGGFVGYVKLSNNETLILTQCENNGKIKGSENNVSGFVGNFEVKAAITLDLQFKSCTNFGEVSGGTNQLAGFLGRMYCENNLNLGDGITFEKCVNYGKITGTGSYVGGFTGRFFYKLTSTANGNVFFNNCENYGIISGSSKIGGFSGSVESKKLNVQFKECTNQGQIGGGQSAGFVGYNSLDADSSMKILNSLNMGSIQSSNQAGGFLGLADNTVSTYEIDGCVNFGSINSSHSKSPFIGGFVAYTQANTTFTIKNSLSAGTLKASGKALETPGIGAFVGVNKAATNSASGGNYYLAVSEETEEGKAFTDNELLDLEAAVNLYNGVTADVAENTKTAMAKIYEIWGEVMIDDSDEKSPIIVLAKPTFAGVQNTAITDGENGKEYYGIRLVSVIDTANYSKVGYKIQVNDAAEVAEYCKTVYIGLYGTVDGKLTEYSAEELGGKYIYALTIKDLLAADTTSISDITYTFKVTPVTVDTDEIEHVGKTYTITYVNGVYSGCTVA